MNPAHPQLHELLAVLVDSELDPHQFDALRSMLQSNGESRRIYRRYIALHAVLLMEGHVDEQNLQEPVFDIQDEPAAAPTRIIGYAGLALAAMLTIAATAWFFLSWSEPRIPDPEPSYATQSVAILTHTENAKFAHDAPRLGQSLDAGVIQLTSGAAQVMFDSTAVVDLSGPAEFELIGRNQALLRWGRLQAYVPRRARGFTINTATFSVVDLGTEFEMRVTPDRSSELAVLTGSVELHPRAGSDRIVRLVAGQASRIDGDGRVLAVIDRKQTEQPIYREVFATAVDTSRPLDETGWRIHKSRGVPSEMQILSHNPNPSKTPIASHPPQNTKVDAYMLTMDDESGVDYLFWTDEFTIDADRWWPTRISWSERHDVRDQQTRLAMRFGSQWFVSDVIENPAAKKDFYPRSVELAKLTWHRLDFEPGKSLQIGRSAIAPIGDITAFGIYVEKRRGFKLRYDSVQIDAIPISGSFQLKESAQ